jgi:hypothetical protein
MNDDILCVASGLFGVCEGDGEVASQDAVFHRVRARHYRYDFPNPVEIRRA